ncbi:hypothetical protein HD554DRAFT_2042002 [Boletus coccyginus]|nr:hypothetical protein HD554DRAFT_2042002 [Boletus coccyginus]
MAKLLDETPQPRNAVVTLRSLSEGRVTHICYPSEKVQVMREDHEQAKATHEQDTLAKAKSHITTDISLHKRPCELTPEPIQEKENHREDQPLPRKQVHHILESDDDEPSMGAKAMAEITAVVTKGECQMTDTSRLSTGCAVTMQQAHSIPNPNGGQPPVGGLKPHPKAGDYDGPTHRILDTTIQFYHALLLTEISFPQSHVEIEWTKTA